MYRIAGTFYSSFLDGKQEEKGAGYEVLLESGKLSYL